MADLKANAKSDVNNLTKTLDEKWKTISKEVNTFDGYKNNKEKISNYYDEIAANCDSFSIKIREYALKYGEIIINSDKSFDDKYDELEKIYDDIYSDITEELYDEVYSDLLEDMYDYYYDGGWANPDFSHWNDGSYWEGATLQWSVSQHAGNTLLNFTTLAYPLVIVDGCIAGPLSYEIITLDSSSLVLHHDGDGGDFTISFTAVSPEPM